MVDKGSSTARNTAMTTINIIVVLLASRCRLSRASLLLNPKIDNLLQNGQILNIFQWKIIRRIMSGFVVFCYCAISDRPFWQASYLPIVPRLALLLAPPVVFLFSLLLVLFIVNRRRLCSALRIAEKRRMLRITKEIQGTT